MGWDRALLTDSGGFQMVSLLDLAEITEDGVKFRSPYDESECMLTPERSIEIQEGISMALKRVRRRALKPKDHHGKRINNLWSFSERELKKGNRKIFVELPPRLRSGPTS